MIAEKESGCSANLGTCTGLNLDSEIGECLLPEHASKKQIRQAGGQTFAAGLKPAPTWNQVVGPGFSPDGSDKRQDASILESKLNSIREVTQDCLDDAGGVDEAHDLQWAEATSPEQRIGFIHLMRTGTEVSAISANLTNSPTWT